MARFRALALTCLAGLAAVAAAPATARDSAVAPTGVQRGGIPVAHMPPVMRAAYLKGIRDELIVHGYDPGPTGDADNHRFRAAIRRYQRDAGLRRDGIASKGLLDHLLFALPKVYADGGRGARRRAVNPGIAPTALAPPAMPPRSRSSAPVPSPAPRGRVSATPLPDPGRSRGPGSPQSEPGPGRGDVSAPALDARGGFVSRTQRLLRERGYYGGPIDGRFGEGLADAIRAFQRDNRLPVTGVIDGPLLEALS